MADVTKALTQIVESLMQIISIQKQGTLQPQIVPKIKKTPDMTYHEFLRKVLAGRKPVHPESKKSSFLLEEDMQLLLELSDQNKITEKTFQTISKQKKLDRNAESIKARYYDCINQLDQKDIKKIINWIENEGIQGYLSIQNGEMVIQKQQAKQEKQVTQKRGRPQSLDKETKKSEKVSKSKKIENIMGDCKQLNQVLKIYSKMVKIPVKQLLQWLDQTSGDLLLLDDYVETQDSRILWSQQQDEILRKGNNAELDLLRKYRGNAFEARRKYLGLN